MSSVAHIHWDLFSSKRGPHQSKVRLKSQHIETLFDFFDLDPNVQAAFKMRMDALLGGQIQFLPMGKPMQEQDARWFNQTYTILCRQIVRCLWSVGFAAIVADKDDEYEGIPRVLDLTQLDIDYWIDYKGVVQIKYYRAMGSHTLGGSTSSDSWDNTNGNVQRALSQVMTIHDGLTVPLMDGQSNILWRSPMATLITDQQLERTLRVAQHIASQRLVQPTVVVNHPFPPAPGPQPGIVTSVDQRVTPFRGDGDGTVLGGAAVAHDSAAHELIARSRQMQVAVNELRLADEVISHYKPAQAPSAAQPVNLDQGLEFAHQLGYQGPDQLLLQVMQARTERILTTLSIPPALLTQRSTLGGSNQQVSESAQNIFNNAQSQLKELLLTFLHEIYTNIYSVAHEKAFLRSQPKGTTRVKRKDLQASKRVDIVIPGMPSDETISEIYQMGLLKYDYLCQYLSARHGIPLTAFEAKPSIDLADLVLGREKPTTGTTAKPKKRAKK